VGDDPWGIDVSTDGQTLFVANEDSSDVSVIDIGTTMVTSIALGIGADPRDVDIGPDGLFAYVPSGEISGSDGVYVIDVASAALADFIETGQVNPNALSMAPEGPSSVIFMDGFESGNSSSW
jgi:YVTN family beta-propeller protein